MSINRKLFNETKSYFCDYDCNPYEMEQFLFHCQSFEERREKASDIIKDIMGIHGKEKLYRHVVELAKVEYGIRELQPWVRDHVVHALISFILGIYLNEKFLNLISEIHVDEFQWKLAGLFHDIGYPLEIANYVLNPYSNKINEIKRELNVTSEDIVIKVVPVGLERLTNNRNSFDLIQNRINEWELEINVEDEYNQMIKSGDICHGMISSLTLLYVIDLMYQKYNPERKYSDTYGISEKINWNQTYFESDVVSACSAIYIHNLPERCFENAKIDRSKAPVAFLLKLSDCLQDWERPKHDFDGFPGTVFDINLNNDQLILHADISDERKEKIKDEILSSLVAHDVRIY
ncbi:hypothetical protein HYG87_01425 [Methanobacterium alkalithermotolerans]|uniref:HD domain-containing protein n=1 Tax=Methanobacterium alkalithermotolerans TaxID=2731220 RepID=A0A8T8K277_9EURY|nr:hypothetical protein [Methanobacterium alkalithermotolerans]QUH22518.1 hypothetical protein HYG87_01425 [Methanobacterium alkalithermotolerans]